MRMRLTYAYTVLSLLLLLPACDQTDPTESDARITEDGVDGVRFGDTQEQVIEKLGPYDGIGTTDGIGRAWQTYFYHEGPHAGLTVRFIEVDGEDERGRPARVAGPVDMLSMEAPYTGTTKKGIGIRSSLEEVRQAYGDPVLVRGHSHYYCLGARDFELVVEADTVQVMGLGYYEPFEGYQNCHSTRQKRNGLIR